VADNNVAVFSFEELCQRPLSSADYFSLCQRFPIIIVYDVRRIPLLTDRNTARRWITLVDEAYDHRVKLLLIGHSVTASTIFDYEGVGAPLDTASHIPEEVFAADRTASRLTEMQTEGYAKEPWRRGELGRRSL